ncbi:MAG: hypothetical protein H7Z16_20580 [Pyrinomonadaceae bacterium]|nr:hypothetical protein [Pyrinomonadaceae bacterium]
MDDRELRSYEMLMRVDNFGDENTAFFPPASLGGELFARIKAAVLKLANHVAQQVSGSTSARQGTATKAMAREALRDDLERLRRTARAMSKTMPGIDSKFRIPRKATDQELIGTAQAFATDAIPFKADFIRFAMPADFLDDLNKHISDFQRALASQQTGKGNQVMATAGIDDTLAEALDDVSQVDAIVRNTFHADAARLAAWTSARHVERSPRRTPSSPATPPGTPTPPVP